MSVTDKLEDAKASIAGLKRKYRFKKNNQQRAQAADLLNDISVCRGKLGVCRNEFNRTIVSQSRSVREGVAQGMDTMIQRNLVWDAAMGYLLVRDAIYSLDSLSSNDSIAHAYDLLDVALKSMRGKHVGSGPIPGVHSNGKDRNKFGYLTSDKTYKDKEAYLSTFFEELLATGDIEACIGKAKVTAIHEGDIASSYAGLSDLPSGSTDGESLDDYMERIRQSTGDSAPDYSDALSDLSIDPPKKN